MPDDWDATIYRQRAEAWEQRAALLPESDPQAAIYLELAKGYRRLCTLIEKRSASGSSPCEPVLNGSSNSDSRGRLLDRRARRAAEEQTRLATESKALGEAARRLQEQSVDLRSQSVTLRADRENERTRVGNRAFRSLSASMLMELAYDLTAIGLHDLSHDCLATAEEIEGGRSSSDRRTRR